MRQLARLGLGVRSMARGGSVGSARETALADLLTPLCLSDTSPAWIPFERYMVEYVSYVLVAVSLAVVSSLLTVKLTRSTDFDTRKNVLVERAKDGQRISTASLGAEGRPRKVMVRRSSLDLACLARRLTPSHCSTSLLGRVSLRSRPSSLASSFTATSADGPCSPRPSA